MTEATNSLTPVGDLLARARAFVTYSHAKNILDAYAADWKHFSGWCDDHKRRASPSSPETILCYVVDLVDRFTVATIDRRLSSISYYHKQARHGRPTKDPEVERTMRGIRRAKGIAPSGCAAAGRSRRGQEPQPAARIQCKSVLRGSLQNTEVSPKLSRSVWQSDRCACVGTTVLSLV